MDSNNQITLTIDGETVSAPRDATLLQVMDSLENSAPVICYHPATTPEGLCRLCVVEVEGWRTLAPSCVTRISEGMVIHTESERVMRARRTILEMLAASVDLSNSSEILSQIEAYEADPERFPGAKTRTQPVKDDNPFYVRDYAKCLLCWRCVQVCAEDAQYAYAINFSGRGYQTQIGTFFDRTIPESTCVFCGQCVGVCPTGALVPKREFLLEQGFSPEEITVLNSGRKRRKVKK